MAWRKLGLLYAPTATHPKLISHAANPLAVHVAGDVFRVYFSGRDAQNRSSVGAVDVDIAAQQVVQHFDAPFFEHGPAGSFYEAGVSIGNCFPLQGKRYIGFMGWQTPPGHWRGDIGRLMLHDDGALTLEPATAWLGVDATDPISLSYPWVMHDGAQYRMWYGSTATWDAGNGEMLHSINHATSADGEQWQRHGVAVPYALGEAQAFSRPTVMRDAEGFHMWYSFRGGNGLPYRIGYAHSADGAQWQRRHDLAGIDVSASGWDSEMVCYPFVFTHKGERHMLYNGNGHGKTGFGLAVWE